MKIWMAAVMTVLCGTAAMAADAARTDLANELVKVMDLEGQMQRSMEMIKKQMPGNIAMQQKAMGMTNEAATKMAADAYAKSFDAIFSGPEFKELQGQMATIYAEVFTEDELKGAIDFFQTPAGKAFVEKQPQVMERSLRLNQQFMMKVMPRLQQQMMEMRKSAGAPPAAP